MKTNDSTGYLVLAILIVAAVALVALGELGILPFSFINIGSSTSSVYVYFVTYMYPSPHMNSVSTQIMHDANPDVQPIPSTVTYTLTYGSGPDKGSQFPGSCTTSTQMNYLEPSGSATNYLAAPTNDGYYAYYSYYYLYNFSATNVQVALCSVQLPATGSMSMNFSAVSVNGTFSSRQYSSSLQIESQSQSGALVVSIPLTSGSSPTSSSTVTSTAPSSSTTSISNNNPGISASPKSMTISSANQKYNFTLTITGATNYGLNCTAGFFSPAWQCYETSGGINSSNWYLEVPSTVMNGNYKVPIKLTTITGAQATATLNVTVSLSGGGGGGGGASSSTTAASTSVTTTIPVTPHDQYGCYPGSLQWLCDDWAYFWSFAWL
jgi:hypothetical protein